MLSEESTAIVQTQANDTLLIHAGAEKRNLQLVVAAEHNPLSVKRSYMIIKRTFDIIISAFALIVTSPITLITAAAIKLEDGGPIIHKRICVGPGNRPYVMHKFRSMVVNADDLDHLLSDEQRKQYIKEVKITNDPRITRVGRIIRRLSIDELPQLFTILKGDMSLVGPRPIVDFEAEFFEDEIDLVLSAKPGLTGYWQVYGRNSAKYETGERQEMELYYIRNRSLWFDFKLLLKTAYSVLHRRGQ